MAYKRRRVTTRRRRRPSYRRRSRYSRPVRRRRRTVMRKKPTISRFALAQANPFHADANGAKIPDSNSVPSCAFQLTDTITLTSHSMGTNAIAFRHTAAGAVVTTASIPSTSTWTWAADFGGVQDNSKLTSVVSNFNVIRTVAQGFRITCPRSPQTITGNCHVCIYTPSFYNKTTWDLPTSIDQMSQQSTYKRFPLATICAKACTVINRSIDFSSEKYFDPSSDCAANANSTASGTTPSIIQQGDLVFQTSGWGVVIIAFDGATTNTSNIIAIESITHMEGVPKTGGLATATPAASYNPSEIGAVSRAVNDSDAIPITEANENAVIQSRGFFDGMYDQAAAMAYQGGRAAAYYGAQSAYGAMSNMWAGNPSSILTRRM